MIIPPKKIMYALFCQLSRVASTHFWREKKLLLDANLGDKGATENIQNYL